MDARTSAGTAPAIGIAPAQPIPTRANEDLREIAIQRAHADLERLRCRLAIIAALCDRKLDVAPNHFVTKGRERLQWSADRGVDQRAQSSVVGRTLRGGWCWNAHGRCAG